MFLAVMMTIQYPLNASLSILLLYILWGKILEKSKV